MTSLAPIAPRPLVISPTSPVTLQTLANLAATDTSLTDTQRRDSSSAISCTSKWLARPPSAIDLRSRTFSAEIAALNPIRLGVAEKTLDNVKSALRSLLKRYGVVPYRSWPSGGVWRDLRALIPEKISTVRLSRFMSDCSACGIEPTAVNDEIVSHYAERAEALFVKNVHQRVREACITWNKLADTVTGWPKQRLVVPSRRKPPTTIPLAQFPEAFQADYERLRERLTTVDPLPEGAASAADPFADVGIRFNSDSAATSRQPKPHTSVARDLDKPLAPTTADVWMRNIHYGASALVQEGVPIEQVLSIATLVDPPHARKILTHYFNKAGARATRFTGHLAYVLKRVAQVYVHADAATIKTLSQYFARMQPKHIGLSEKNEKNLRDLDDRGKAMLLAVPQMLIKRALQANRPRRQMAVDLKIAAVVGLILYAPVRGENLCAIRLGHHLTIPPDPRADGLLHFAAHEVKNRIEITLTVPSEVLRIIRLYMAHARPLLMDPTLPMLFPISKRKDQDFLNHQVKKRVRDLTGLNVNIHLFRHIAAKLYLDDHPGEYEVVRNLLGHTRIQTTISFYCGLEREAAIRHFQSELQRKATEALPVRRRRRPTNPASPKNPPKGGTQ